MKVLNVNMSLDPVTGGGTVERTFQMSLSFAKKGLDCSLLTTSIGITAERIRNLEGVNVHVLKTLNKRFFVPLFSYARIKNIVKQVDIIHLMNHWTILNVLIYFIASRLKKPYVVCPAGALPIYGRTKIIKKLYNMLIGKRIIRNAKHLIAIAENEINHFQSYGIERDKISIIPNGVNEDDFLANDAAKFREKYGLGSDPFIMFIGRLNPIKGPDLLLRAFCNVKDRLEAFHLVFVGPDEEMLDELKDMAAEAELSDRVHFIGYLGGADKSHAYHAAELVVVPSRQEAMSIVVLEAGITGTPILLTDQCGFDGVATIGGGKVVPATVDALQDGLIELLSNTEQLKSMGERLKSYTYENFLWDNVVNKYIELYSRLIF